MAPSLNIGKVPMTPLRVMVVVAGVAAICLVFSALNASSPNQKLGTMFLQDSKTVKRQSTGKTMADGNFWKNADLLAEEIPAQVTDAVSTVKVDGKYVNVQGIETFYREAEPPQGITSSGEVVILLHGMAFKSETWLTLGTINILAAMGHRVIAIDLPGFGETTGRLSGDEGEYLKLFINSKKANQPILVSPSMSGGFAFPFILQNPEGLSGFVPVAPVSSGTIVSLAPKLTIPTLIIYGEKDHNLGQRSLADLSNIPTSQARVVPKGSHPAYLDNPQLFHKLLYNFINQVHEHKS